MKITRIWFDADYIYGETESGKKYRQSLLWYPGLMNATDGEATWGCRRNGRQRRGRRASQRNNPQ